MLAIERKNEILSILQKEQAAGAGIRAESAVQRDRRDHPP